MPDGPAYALLGAAPAAPPWNGATTRLAQYASVSMPETPNGSMLLAYRNASLFNSAGKLAWTSGGSQPVILVAPALPLAPSVFAHDWAGNNLTITNISVGADTPIDVEAYGPGIGAAPVPLPVGAPGVQLTQSQAAQGATTGGWMQLGFRQSSGDPAVFGFIGGPPVNADGTNAYVIALNSTAGDTGPNTGKAPPPGYYATSSGNGWSYELNWPSGLLYVAYFGAAQVVTGLGVSDQLPTVTLIRL